MIKSTFGQEPNQSLNPDEAVALGAAVEGEVLSGQVKGILLMDSTSLSLGVNACGGEMNVIIPRNTTIPTKRSEVYTTAKDNQTEVVIEVFQGDRPLARNNKRLGNFHLGGLPPAPRGVPQIEVIFDIDTNGIVHVMARDQSTGKDASITLTGDTGLSTDEINAMAREADSHPS
jgi:molecular chaperone DnaK